MVQTGRKSIIWTALGRNINKAKSIPQKLQILKQWVQSVNAKIQILKCHPKPYYTKLEDGEIGAFSPEWDPLCATLNTYDGTICLHPRGYKTEHPGLGLCRNCENKLAHGLSVSGEIYKPGNKKMLMLNRSNGMPAKLKECLAASQQIDYTISTKVQPDLKTIYGLIQFILEGGLHNTEEFDLSREDLAEVRQLMKLAVECKKVIHVMEQQSQLDPVTVKSFVGQVLNVVFNHVDRETSRKIGGEIMDRVIKPFRNTGKMVGTDEEYHQIGRGIANSIAVEEPFEKNAVDPKKVSTEIENGLNQLKQLQEDWESKGQRFPTTKDPQREKRTHMRRSKRNE